MTPFEYIDYIMNIRNINELLDQRNYKNIRNGIGHFLLSTDRYESMDEGFEPIEISSLNEYSEIDDAIEYYIGNKHIVSELLRKQMEELEQNNCILIDEMYYPYNIRDIYWTMEKVVKESSSIEILPFTRGELLTGKNIFHVHHNQTNSLGKNAKRYLDAHYDYKAFREKILELKNDRKDPTIRQLLHDFTYVMLMNSLDSSKRNPDWKMTGEWVVFQKLESGIVNFLCLATHDEGCGNGDQLFNKIKDYLI